MAGKAGNCKIERAHVLRLWRMESTEAILIRKRKFSDTSLIVSWCTDSFGCVQTVAKGARRLKSPFAGKLDLFFEAEISIVRSRKTDLHTLTEVELKDRKSTRLNSSHRCISYAVFSLIKK